MDEKILRVIKKNSRMPYEVIGKKVGLTRNAIKNRILKLEEKRQFWKKNHKGQGTTKPKELWDFEDGLYNKIADLKGIKRRVF